MSIGLAIIALFFLIILSGIIASSEIALSAAKKFRLQTLAREGCSNAKRVIKIQEKPVYFITVVQIGLNTIAILAGIIGESAITPYINEIFIRYQISSNITFNSLFSFVFITSVFILFADLIPKKLAIIEPEKIALSTIRFIELLIFILKPIIWCFSSLSILFFKLFNKPEFYQDKLTSEDIYAVVDAGAEAGLLNQQEYYLIENIFNMQQRTVTSSMTVRENIVFFNRDDDRDILLNKIIEEPHSNFLVCEKGLENILGYIDSKTLLSLFLKDSENMTLPDSKLLNKVLFIPDSLSLYEVLELFKSNGEEFAVIINEYSLVVGMITLKDVMNIVMGDLLQVDEEEQQIIQRDNKSWLIDGTTPLDDVVKVLNIKGFPHSDNYETISGFMMYSLRKIPRKTDFVLFDKYKFEVINTEGIKVDQLLVSIIADTDITDTDLK